LNWRDSFYSYLLASEVTCINVLRLLAEDVAHLRGDVAARSDNEIALQAPTVRATALYRSNMEDHKKTEKVMLGMKRRKWGYLLDATERKM
jgi:hypothetical protein